MSPTAQTFSRPVRQRSSVSTKPRSMRDALLLVPEPVGRRPAADGDQQQLGLDDVAALDGHGDPVVGGLHALERRAGAQRDLRACGTPARAPWTTPRPPARTSRGSASTIVTSAPKLRHTLANSQPMTPPPSTITDAGTRSRRSACSEVMIRCAVEVEPGQGLGVGAARQHHVAAGVRRLAGSPATVTSRGPVSRPRPR